MKAIILAAGRGRRLQSLTKGRHKCTLEIGKESLIKRQVRLLKESGVKEEDVYVVVGYKAGHIQKALTDFKVTYVENTLWPKSNTSLSLAVGLKKALYEIEEGEEILMMNGDVYFSNKILEPLLEIDGTAMVVKGKKTGMEEIKVVIEEGLIKGVEKFYFPEKCDGEAVGINKMTQDFARYYIQECKSTIRTHYFERVFDTLIKAGHKVKVVGAGEELVEEIDTPEDYNELKAKIRV